MKGFIYNPNTCTGCNACKIACQDAHGLNTYQFFRNVLYLEEFHHFISISCNHCQDAACVKACSNGAMVKEGEITVHYQDRCIGCGKCMNACPYQAISLSKKHGWAQKCDSCQELRKEGKDPVCVASCPTHSLAYGDISQQYLPKVLESNTKPQFSYKEASDETL